jgi:hypothetical protein
MTSENVLREAERTVVNMAKAAADFQQILSALEGYGDKAFRYDSKERDQFFEGLQLMRQAAFTCELQRIAECFCFAGTGEGEAAEYSRQQFMAYFGKDERECLLRFLEYHGNTPKAWTEKPESEKE